MHIKAAHFTVITLVQAIKWNEIFMQNGIEWNEKWNINVQIANQIKRDAVIFN